MESSVDALLNFISEDCCVSVEVMLLEGLQVSETFKLCDGVYLAELKDVPSESLRHFMDNFSSKSLPPSPMAKTFNADDSERPKLPDSALFRVKEIRPKFFDADNPKWEKFDVEDMSLLEDVSNLLTLIGPSSPIVRRRYWDLKDGSLMSDFTGRIAGAQPAGTKVFSAHMAKKHEVEGFKIVLEKYLQLSVPERKRFDVPLHRLNKAVRHEINQGPKDALQDKAIDLAIALESLLLSDQNDGVQLSLNLRLRGAWLAGGDVARRQEVFKLLGIIYNARSRAVHSGAVPSKQRDEVELSLQKGLVLCADLISKVIATPPDWQLLILGGGVAPATPI